MRFAIQPTQTEIGYCAKNYCLRRNGQEDLGQTPLQHIMLPSSVNSILYQHACDHRDGAATAC